MTETAWQWIDVFSEGGPFLLAEEPAFRAWKGAGGWGEVLSDLEAPGKLQTLEDHTVCLFDPEDPGPVQVGWSDDRLVLVRWSRGGDSPLIVRDLKPAERTAYDARVRAVLDAKHEDKVDFGRLELTDGLVVISWAAISGSDLVEDRAGVHALARSQPHETRRYRDSGPALTAVLLQPGVYDVSALFGFFDEEHDDGGTWVELKRRA